MNDQTQVWQENFDATRNNMWICFDIGVACFAIAIEIGITGDTLSISDYLQKYFWLLGTITFATVSAGFCFASLTVKLNKPSNMLATDQEAYEKRVRKVNGYTILSFMLFGYFNYKTDGEMFIHWISGDIVSATILSVGLCFFAFAVLSYNFAVKIKTKYLSG